MLAIVVASGWIVLAVVFAKRGNRVLLVVAILFAIGWLVVVADRVGLVAW